MCSRPAYFLLLCLLTIVGSGDDFNVLRAAFPVTFASSPAGGLPLDDPNTDFLARSTSRPQGHWGDGTVLAGADVPPAYRPAVVWCLPALPVCASDRHVPCPSIMPPLRC
jgi:hypothetical protein